MDKNLSESVLTKIKADHLKPHTHFYFIVINSIFLILGIVSIVIGAFAFSIILLVLSNLELDMWKDIPRSQINFLLEILPFFWAMTFVIFGVFAIWGVHHTRKGYKIPLKIIFLGNIGLSVVLGLGLHWIGGGEIIEEILEKRVPPYSGMNRQMEVIWTRPNNGRLAGIVLEIQDEGIIILNDFDKKEWRIVNNKIVQKENVFFPVEGDAIKVLGEKISDNEFEAFIIRPLQQKMNPKLLPRMFHPDGKIIPQKNIPQEKNAVQNTEKSEYIPKE